MNSKEKTH